MVHRGRCSAFARSLLQLNIDGVCHLKGVATEALAKPVAHGRTLGDATTTVTTWSYAGRQDNLVTGITISSSAQTMPSFGYTYDANQNKLTEAITGVMPNCGFGDVAGGATTYDPEDRLTNWNRDDSNLVQSWPQGKATGLSPAGDWQTFVQSVNGGTPTTQTRTHNWVHELTQSGSNSLAYADQKGNLTTDANGQVYAWDFNNRMQTATVSGGAASTYAYDALGRRVSKSVGSATATVYVSDGNQEIAEYPLSGAAASPQMKYVYGQYIDEPVMMVNSSGTFYYHQNNLYSVAALTAASDGSLKECYAYTPYGTPTVFSYSGGTLTDITASPSSWLGNPFLFTGRRYDTETGLQYSRARYYSSALGRFLSRDPIDFRGGVNLYEYAGDDPLARVDPRGSDSYPIWALPACGSGTNSPLPSPIPKPEGTCGLDITDRLQQLKAEMEAAFSRAPSATKESACYRMHGVGEAWDITETLNNGGGNFTSGSCGAGACEGTVQVNGLCYLAGEVNYYMWGLANRLCSDYFYGKTPSPAAAAANPWDLAWAVYYTAYYRSLKTGGGWFGDGIRGQVQWTKAGYTGQFPGADYTVDKLHGMNCGKCTEEKAGPGQDGKYHGTLTGYFGSQYLIGGFFWRWDDGKIEGSVGPSTNPIKK